MTVAYFALVSSHQPLQAGLDAEEAKWFSIDQVPTLAFDHASILAIALRRLQGKLEYTNVGFELLPPRFTLSELQAVHEAVLGKALDRRNFRRMIEMQGHVEETDEFRPTGPKPARLFRFTGGR